MMAAIGRFVESVLYGVRVGVDAAAAHRAGLEKEQMEKLTADAAALRQNAVLARAAADAAKAPPSPAAAVAPKPEGTP